jgi:DNA-binding PadR family transcriptional regulator
MHPYEVAQTLRQRAKQESVRLNYGSLYAVVDSLEKRGLIRATETIREGRRPERTVYEITDEGAREMVDWLTELLALPDDALRALRQRADGLGFKLAALRGTLDGGRRVGLPRLFALESEYEAGQLAAELRFVTGLIADIESGDLDGLVLWRGLHDGTSEPPGEVHFTVEPELGD